MVFQCSYLDGAPFHETTDKQASGPHTNTHSQEIKSPILYKWQILSWGHIVVRMAECRSGTLLRMAECR